MNNTNLDVDLTQEADMDAPDLVLGWLERLGTADWASAEQSASEDEKLPSTPTRQHTQEHLEDISPTTTKFSSDSIFDTPYVDTAGSPHAHNDTSSNTDATSVGYQEDSSCEDQLVSTAEKTASLDSYEAPSNLDFSGHIHDARPETPEKHDPDLPELVWITSCLQCTLANLPCSRTLPGCSRCQRSGHSDLCLLQRRKVPSRGEFVRGNTVLNTTPVLLKVQGEDEELWNRKAALMEELHQYWLEEQDRRNWVLPSPYSTQGGFKRQGNRTRTALHPGEEVGRRTYKNLHLA
ncbi:hypothetical protein BDV95DRAFT_202338 [Massariosphaeria phaeospora]|uniref:Zn(2)-C6 fungal-type domain-containing protein n=1 Tax=Massariosphaeria phaeospora TaxID=100035 RepID=A0A7C8I6P1_9PLEO|nr:hypothetical protein BDV95DRAFT_202338 [Massariosphaeria phaeospora]